MNQALGRQLNGEHNFVAGKETVIRVFLDREVPVLAEQSRLVIQRDGQDVATLAPRPYQEPVGIVEFLCPSMKACGEWAAGKYRFAATVNGVTRSTDGTDYIFKVRQKLRILAVPIKANYNGTITTVTDDEWKQGWTFTRHTYPVAADKIVWEVKGELDASGPDFNLETEGGQQKVWEALKNLVPQECTANPKAEGCYELVVGFISDRPVGYPNGTLQGFTYGRPANIVVASDEDMQATVAHEIGHVFGVGDTYDGGTFRCGVNPAPDTYTGKDWDTDEPTACTAGRLAYPDEDVSATWIPADQRPYEVGGRGELDDMACYMGSGGAMEIYWTSQEVYSQIYAQLDPVLFQTTSAKSPRQAAGFERLLHFSGFLTDRNEIRKRPWYSFTSTSPVPDTTGEIMLQAVDAAGGVLASQKLNVEFVVHSRPVRRLSAAAFDGAIRFPEATSKFQIVRNGRVLAEIAVSAHAPAVTGVTADGGLISWAASDLDGDRLSYIVEYNRDPADPDSKWVVLAADLDSPQWQANLATLAGGNAARIRVTASDGIRATTAESQEFMVPFKAPEVTAGYEAGSEVILTGSAQDLQDGLIADNRLVWTSNLVGQIGTGSRLVLANLPAGEHKITLTATNSAGLSAVQTLTVAVTK